MYVVAEKDIAGLMTPEAAFEAIEAVFAIPGTGSLVVTSATNKDFPVVQGVVFVLVLMVILCNLLIDVLYSVLDPRMNKQ